MSRLMFPQLQDCVKYKMASVLLHLFISIIADGIAIIFMQNTIFTIYFWNWHLWYVICALEKEPQDSTHYYKKPVHLHTQEEKAECIAKQRYFKWGL